MKVPKTVRHIYNDPFTMVEISQTITINNKKIQLAVVGFAKRLPCDEPNEEVGYNVAYTRALEQLKKKRREIKAEAKASK